MTRKVRIPGHIRPAKELSEIINFIRAKYMLEGIKPPSVASITKIIANEIDKKKLWEKIFIRF